MTRRTFLVVSIMCCAVTIVMAQRMHRYSLGFELSKHDFADTLQVEWDDNRLLLPVEISGKTYRFLFDTGCTQGVIFTGSQVPYVEEIGNIVSYDINNHRDTVRVVQMPPMRLGQMTIDGYLCTVAHSGTATRGYDGIIGFDLINKGLACKIDVENKRLILTDRKKFFADEQGYEVKYKLQGFVPYVWVSPFMRHMDQVLFDTGFRHLYAMNSESFLKHVYKSRQVSEQVEGRAVGQHTIGAHSVETADTVYFLALDRLKWDAFSFRDYHTVTQQGSSHIGADVLNYGRIIINPFRKRIILQPYTKNDEVTISNPQFQMYIIPINNRPTVGLIRQESEAYKSGLRQGDVILKVDGRDIPSITIFQRLRFVSGQSYTYTVRDKQGRIKEVRLKKE